MNVIIYTWLWILVVTPPSTAGFYFTGRIQRERHGAKSRTWLCAKREVGEESAEEQVVMRDGGSDILRDADGLVSESGTEVLLSSQPLAEGFSTE
jgi:hypothetical protein